MDLSKFDLSYDLRDRARLLRSLFFKKKKKKGDTSEAKLVQPSQELKDAMKKGLLTEKPTPEIIHPYAGELVHVSTFDSTPTFVHLVFGTSVQAAITTPSALCLT